MHSLTAIFSFTLTPSLVKTSLIIRVRMVFHVFSTCTGWSVVLVLPIPSTVVTAIPSTAHNGSKQPFAEKCMENVKDNREK